MPKFFVKNNQIENNIVKILGEDVKHISNVLRMMKFKYVIQILQIII